MTISEMSQLGVKARIKKAGGKKKFREHMRKVANARYKKLDKSVIHKPNIKEDLQPIA